MRYKSSSEFLESENKAITLIGMSGVGKSHLALMMAEWGWYHYSCDVEIGTKYLTDKLSKPVTADDISPLSDFIGKLGDVSLEEFKHHQKLYYDAEVRALEAVPDIVSQYPKFVNDSTGSICEIIEDEVLDRLGQSTLFVYIRASKNEEKEILQRAQDYPKPLFYPQNLLDAWVNEYMQIFVHDDESNIEADEFVRWVFPRLFETRLPKYQRLADLYGVTIPTEQMYQVKTEHDFLNLISEALN